MTGGVNSVTPYFEDAEPISGRGLAQTQGFWGWLSDENQKMGPKHTLKWAEIPENGQKPSIWSTEPAE